MKQLLNFIPLVCFFVALLTDGIIAGTKVLMISSVIVLIITFVIYKKISKMDIAMFLIVMLFGSLTLYLDESFIKWKITIVNGAFAFTLLVFDFILNKNLIKKLLSQKFSGKQITVSDVTAKKLNLMWASYFLFSALVNIYVIYYCSDEIFGYYKVIVLPIISFTLAIITAVTISKGVSNVDDEINQIK